MSFWMKNSVAWRIFSVHTCMEKMGDRGEMGARWREEGERVGGEGVRKGRKRY